MRHKDKLGKFIKEHNFSDEELIDLYVNKKLTAKDISKKFGCSGYPVYHRLRALGIIRNFGETRKLNKTVNGENNPNWKGGKYLKCGYVLIRIGTGKYVPEHRYVAEQKLGRKLNTKEVIHHIDGDRSNNTFENLQIFSSHSEHMKIHLTSEEARKRGKNGHHFTSKAQQ